MGDGRDLNETWLRNIAATWHTDQAQVFESVEVFPPEKEDRIVGRFPESHYPREIDGAHVELRVRLNGDLNLRYAENWPGESWECQWDRHENPHNDYEHFHTPPKVRSDEAGDVRYSDPPFGVVQVAFEFIEDRVGDLWDGSLTAVPARKLTRLRVGGSAYAPSTNPPALAALTPPPLAQTL